MRPNVRQGAGWITSGSASCGAISTMRARTWPSVSSGSGPPERLGERAQDLPVLPRLAGREHGESAALRPALGIDVGRVLLGIGGPGQDHVRARRRRGRRGGPGRSRRHRRAPPCRSHRRRAGTGPRSRPWSAAGSIPATSRPPLPGTRPRSRPPTRAAAVCRTLKPFQSSLTKPKRSAIARAVARIAAPSAAPRARRGRGSASAARPASSRSAELVRCHPRAGQGLRTGAELLDRIGQIGGRRRSARS